MIIGKLKLKEKLDVDGKLRLTKLDGEIVDEINRDEAMDFITHLFKMFDFEIHAIIIQSNES